MEEQIAADAGLVRQRFGEQPYDLAVILGSGLGHGLEIAAVVDSIEFSELRGAPAAMIPGHAGRLVQLQAGERHVLAFQGRFHCYQGISARQAAYPARLAAALNIPRLLITSAVGGISPGFGAGSFVYLSDHINLLGDNPLKGEVPPRFIDLCGLYRQDLFSELEQVAELSGIVLHRGVLAALQGPSYETPAEIQMLRRLGADIVSMSMVPEAIMAGASGMQVVGLTLVTNLAAGIGSSVLDHQHVLTAGQSAAGQFRTLFETLLVNWD